MIGEFLNDTRINSIIGKVGDELATHGVTAGIDTSSFKYTIYKLHKTIS